MKKCPYCHSVNISYVNRLVQIKAFIFNPFKDLLMNSVMRIDPPVISEIPKSKYVCKDCRKIFN